VQHLLGLPHEIAERRAHLVGEVLAEARQPREALFQPIEHLVHSRTQRLQLAGHGRFIEAQVQVLHVDGQGLAGQVTHRAQGAPADQPAEQGRQQGAEAQRPPELGAVGGQHLLALGQHAPGHQCQPRLTRQPPPGQPRAFGIAQRRGVAGRQWRYRQPRRVDFDQCASLRIEQPEQAVAIAQHVLVQLRPLAQRLDAGAVLQQRLHALQPAKQRLVVTPADLALQRAVQIQADGTEQHHRDQGESQRQAQAERARQQAHSVGSST